MSDRSRPSRTVVPGAPSSAVLEQAVRALLRVRPGREMEMAVLEEACRITSATTGALYRHGDGAYQLRACSGPDLGCWEALAAGVDGALGGISGVRSFGGAGTRGSDPADAVRVAAGLRFADGPQGILVLGEREGEGPYGARELMLLERGLDAFAVALENAAAFDRLSALVLVDALTGCHNRRGFDEHLKVEMVRARRYRRPLSLMVLDIDHFKLINDNFGHLVGDDVLRRVGAVLHAQFRTTDVVCRFGGDEFAVIFPETSRTHVMRLAERLRTRIERLYPDAALPHPVTVSLGIAGFPDDAAEPETLLHAADQALYRAKAGGRNRVTRA